MRSPEETITPTSQATRESARYDISGFGDNPGFRAHRAKHPYLCVNPSYFPPRRFCHADLQGFHLRIATSNLQRMRMRMYMSMDALM